MFRKTIGAATISGALVMAPTAAFATGAYPAPEDSLTCSVTQAKVNTTFTCTVEGPDGAPAQLQTTFSGADATIAGTVTSPETNISSNQATWTVTAPEIGGTMGITGIIDGEAVDTAQVLVTAANVDGGDLSSTGFGNLSLAIGAGAFLVVGAGAVVVAARRRGATT